MADNPLLPQARLRELYALMQRCRVADRKRTAGKRQAGDTAREGLLAATAMQLGPGDLLSPEPGDLVAGELAPPPAAEGAGTGVSAPLPPAMRLALCAGVAAGLQLAGSHGLVLAYLRAGTLEHGWAEALAWAQRDRLPLVLACSDSAGPGRKRQGDTVTADAMAQLSQRSGLPVFPVDGEDAVAVYRVMYESVLRARSGGGPAVIWGHLSRQGALASSRAAQPSARLARYMKSRGISLAG